MVCVGDICGICVIGIFQLIHGSEDSFFKNKRRNKGIISAFLVTFLALAKSNACLAKANKKEICWDAGETRVSFSFIPPSKKVADLYLLLFCILSLFINHKLGVFAVFLVSTHEYKIHISDDAKAPVTTELTLKLTAEISCLVIEEFN